MSEDVCVSEREREREKAASLLRSTYRNRLIPRRWCLSTAFVNVLIVDVRRQDRERHSDRDGMHEKDSRDSGQIVEEESDAGVRIGDIS